MIPKLVAQSDGLGVVVIDIARLMRECRIEGHALIVITVAVPNTVACDAIRWLGIGSIRIRIRKSIAHIEHCHPIDHTTCCAKASSSFSFGNSGCPRNAIDGGSVRREVWKIGGLRRIQIPRPHDVTREPGGADVNPVR